VGAAAGAESDVDRSDSLEELSPQLVGLAVLLVDMLIVLGNASAEQCSSALESSGHISRGEQAVVPDFHEAVRQHVLEKSTQEDERWQCCGLVAAGPQRDDLVGSAHETRVADSDSERAATEVSIDLLGMAKGRLA
jgi:hypothetical protein